MRDREWRDTHRVVRARVTPRTVWQCASPAALQKRTSSIFLPLSWSITFLWKMGEKQWDDELQRRIGVARRQKTERGNPARVWRKRREVSGGTLPSDAPERAHPHVDPGPWMRRSGHPAQPDSVWASIGPRCSEIALSEHCAVDKQQKSRERATRESKVHRRVGHLAAKATSAPTRRANLQAAFRQGKTARLHGTDI